VVARERFDTRLAHAVARPRLVSGAIRDADMVGSNAWASTRAAAHTLVREAVGRMRRLGNLPNALD
jgi:hypothetical protein